MSRNHDTKTSTDALCARCGLAGQRNGHGLCRACDADRLALARERRPVPVRTEFDRRAAARGRLQLDDPYRPGTEAAELTAGQAASGAAA